MSISIEEFITDFAYKLNNEQVSVFIGSGVSTELKLPNWKDLFKDIAAKISLNIDEIDDYYQLAQYYSNKYSVSDLKRSILPKIQTLNTDSPTLNNLLDLKFHSIWTTNFDNAIENCLFSKKINYLKVHNDKDLACINMNDYPIIYKINGDISDLDNIILTQRDWENFTYKRPTMLNFLNKELVSNTFLFIGYSFKDKLVKTSLSTIQQFVGNNGMHHYAIFEKDNKIEFKYYIDDLEKNYSKKEIFELYVNTAYFGDGYYGIYDASYGYYNKSPKDLNLDEASMLAGVPNAPSVYAPTVNPNLAKKRQYHVLNTMLEYGYITKEQAISIK